MAKLYTLIILMLIFGSAIVFADATFTLTSNSNSANVGDEIEVTLTFASGGDDASFTGFDLNTTGLTLSSFSNDQVCFANGFVWHCEYFGFPANPLTFSAHVDALPATINLTSVQVSSVDGLTDLNVNFVGSPLTIQVAGSPPPVLDSLESCHAVGSKFEGGVCVACPAGNHLEGNSCVPVDVPGVGLLSSEDLIVQLEAVLRNAPPSLNRLQQISHIARLLTLNAEVWQ